MAAVQMAAGPSAASPLAYPEGWFQVSYAEDLAAGQVMPLHYFGRDLVLFRTDSGVPQVLDGHCVHLGAHLGHGGRVEGERIRCPFHSWAYGTDGVCQDIPYAERVPRGARQRAWPTLEQSGLIWVWHSPLNRESTCRSGSTRSTGRRHCSATATT